MIYTSFYNNNNIKYKYRKKFKLIAISNTYPVDVISKPEEILSIFIPPWNLVRDYKEGLIDIDQYTKKYNIIFNELNVHYYANLLSNCVLLCWCHPKKFCHRQLIADWFISNKYLCLELDY